MTGFSDIKAQLGEATKDAYTEGFEFALEHGPAGTQATLSNGEIGDILALADGVDNLVLSYGLTKLEGSAVQTHKSELVRTKGGLSLRRSELATGRVIGEFTLPPAHDLQTHDDHKFETLNECIAAFDGSSFQSELQALANKTCLAQFGHLHCCLTDGNCYSVVLIVKPTSWKCLVSIAYDPSEVFAPING